MTRTQMNHESRGLSMVLGCPCPRGRPRAPSVPVGMLASAQAATSSTRSPVDKLVQRSHHCAVDAHCACSARCLRRVRGIVGRPLRGGPCPGARRRARHLLEAAKERPRRHLRPSTSSSVHSSASAEPVYFCAGQRSTLNDGSIRFPGRTAPDAACRGRARGLALGGCSWLVDDLQKDDAANRDTDRLYARARADCSAATGSSARVPETRRPTSLRPPFASRHDGDRLRLLQGRRDGASHPDGDGFVRRYPNRCPT